jgi:hypothetical protein
MKEKEEKNMEKVNIDEDLMTVDQQNIINCERL